MLPSLCMTTQLRRSIQILSLLTRLASIDWIDARTFWNMMSDGANGYISYEHTGWGAERGEREKRSSWEDKGAIDRRRARAVSANDVEFVPFSIEAGGAWGPAARKFFVECLKLADSDRDVDLYHWSSAKFSSTWYDTLSVLGAHSRRTGPTVVSGPAVALTDGSPSPTH